MAARASMAPPAVSTVMVRPARMRRTGLREADRQALGQPGDQGAEALGQLRVLAVEAGVDVVAQAVPLRLDAADDAAEPMGGGGGPGARHPGHGGGDGDVGAGLGGAGLGGRFPGVAGGVVGAAFLGGGAAVADQQDLALAPRPVEAGEAQRRGQRGHRVVLGDMHPGGAVVEGRAEAVALGEGAAAGAGAGFQHQAGEAELAAAPGGGDARGPGADDGDVQHQAARKRGTSPGSITSRPWRCSRRRCARVSPTVKPIWPISPAARGNSTCAAS